MKKALSYAKEFFHRADIFLLVMGLICATFGIIVISSATASYHSAKYVIVQSASLILGVVAFVDMTVLDVDVLAPIDVVHDPEYGYPENFYYNTKQGKPQD